MFEFILLLILIFCNFIMAFVSSLAAKPHNYVIVENTFPADKMEEPQVLAFRKDYRKRQFQLAFGLSIAAFLLLIPMKESLFMLLFFFLLYLSIGSAYLLQLRYIRRGRQLIVANQWQLTEQPIRVDTKLVLEKNRKLVSPWWFVLSIGSLILLTALTARQGAGSLTWILFGVCSVALVLFILSWASIKRLPTRALTDDSSINQQYNDLTKFYWSTFIVATSVFINLIAYIPILTMNSSSRLFSDLMISEFLLIFLFCGLTFWWLFRLRTKQDQLLAQTPSFRYAGDDYYWRYGIYCNPDDRRLMIPDRIGMNLTINLGRIGGKIFLATVPLLLIVAMVVSVGPPYILDYHPDPLTYQIQQKSIRLDGPLTKEQKISYDEIKTVALIETLPDSGMKINGLGTKDYALGSFKIDGKPASLFVDHRSKPILKISTNERDYYYTNIKPAVTKKAYQQIQSHR